jgi:hypothetical protein
VASSAKAEVVSDREEIDAAKVKALVAVLKDALPRLVSAALDRFKTEWPRFKTELPSFLIHLSDDEWKRPKRNENRRRRGAKLS